MVEGGAWGGTTCAPAVGKIYKAIQQLECGLVCNAPPRLLREVTRAATG